MARVFELPPKKNSHSLVADSTESLPWTAFLVPSVPNIALRELGASYLAYAEFVGPINCLHPFIAPVLANSIPTQTSLVTNS